VPVPPQRGHDDVDELRVEGDGDDDDDDDPLGADLVLLNKLAYDTFCSYDVRVSVKVIIVDGNQKIPLYT
jgi:hypothetical protein